MSKSTAAQLGKNWRSSALRLVQGTREQMLHLSIFGGPPRHPSNPTHGELKFNEDRRMLLTNIMPLSDPDGCIINLKVLALQACVEKKASATPSGRTHA